MKVIAIIVNIFFPGIGTLIIGKIGTGVTQLILTIIGAILVASGLFSIIGIPLLIGAWIWSLVTVAGSENKETIIIREVSVAEKKDEKSQ